MARPKGLHFMYIRLVNDAGLDEDERKLIITKLIDLYHLVVRRYLEMFPDAQFPFVQPTFHDGELAEHDLRCFVLSSKRQSRVRKLGSSDLGPGGTTHRTRDGKAVSEVYIQNFPTEYLLIARLIFHEFMHNKLQMGDDMHSDYDIGFGLAREQVSGESGMGHLSDGITQKNATVMAQALFKLVPQYEGP